MSKEYLDKCWYCGENKEAVRASQRPGGDHIICGIVDSFTGELLSEIKGGRHTFVVTDAERKSRKDEEEALAKDMGDMVAWFEAKPYTGIDPESEK